MAFSPDLPPVANDLARLQASASLFAVSIYHDDVVHLPVADLRLQASLVRCPGRRYTGRHLCFAGGQLRFGFVREVQQKDVSAVGTGPGPFHHAYERQPLKKQETCREMWTTAPLSVNVP